MVVDIGSPAYYEVAFHTVDCHWHRQNSTQLSKSRGGELEVAYWIQRKEPKRQTGLGHEYRIGKHSQTKTCFEMFVSYRSRCRNALCKILIRIFPLGAVTGSVG